VAGAENLAAMLNSMSTGDAGRMAELFAALSTAGAEAYAQFCNRATADQAKAFAAWVGAADAQQVKRVADRLNAGGSVDPRSFLAWLEAPDFAAPAPARKWWQFWKRSASSPPESRDAQRVHGMVAELIQSCGQLAHARAVLQAGQEISAIQSKQLDSYVVWLARCRTQGRVLDPAFALEASNAARDLSTWERAVGDAAKLVGGIVERLVAIGRPAVATLREYLAHENEHVRAAVSGALQRIENPASPAAETPVVEPTPAAKRVTTAEAQFHCSKCNKLLKSNLIGTLVRCPGCKETIRVPEPRGAGPTLLPGPRLGPAHE
jgi:Zn finger protein HypA/HybF involved in hydrogenase expression